MAGKNDKRSLDWQDDKENNLATDGLTSIEGDFIKRPYKHKFIGSHSYRGNQLHIQKRGNKNDSNQKEN